jgi:Cdc6-like AAA superfamily ATPase
VSPRPELIADAEITNAQDDALGHEQLTEELLQLIRQARTPSNVALYGPWGAGKSGIGHLLAAEIEKRYAKELAFARFDAFKYARNPLRRNFISVIAGSLGVTDSRFGQDLYESKISSKVQFPLVKLLKLSAILLGSGAGIAAALAGLAAVVAMLQDQPVWPALTAAALSSIPASLVPASLLTAVVAVANKAFVTEHSSERAESDEEFERLFRDLVATKVKGRTLVVFVDELDRCAPSDVIDTLDSIRTFFGVPGCIFVVAADQQVLENAMTQSLRQATPLDDVNPYYSAGSSYLDKVFQYQMTLPPLRAGSVTAFAAALVAGRAGVWQQVNTATIASILIPAHVRAPRRVKHLLNSFVLAHRLAAARVQSGDLTFQLGREEAEALARLICLQVEFPLFARDMVLDPELPQHVVGVASDGRDQYWHTHPGVEVRVQQLVDGYVENTRWAGAIVTIPDADDQDADAVRTTQGNQLLSYLHRTSNVTGPYRDLLFLESAGVASNLPGTLAQQVELAARDGGLLEVRNLFSRMNGEQRAAAVHFLTQMLRTAVGIEGPNITKALLVAVPMAPIDAPAADAIALEIDQNDAFPPNIVGTSTLEGALEVASSASEFRRRSLVRRIADSGATAASDIGARLAIDYSTTLRTAGTLVQDAVRTRLISDDAEQFAAELESVNAEALALVIDESEEMLSASLQNVLEAHEAWQKAREPASSSKTSRRVEPDDEEELIEPLNPAGIIAAFNSIATMQADREHQPALIPLLRVLLRTGQPSAADAVRPLLPSVAEAIDDTFAELLLRVGRRRNPSEWSEWTALLVQYPESITAAIRPHLAHMVDRLWTRRFMDTAPDSIEVFTERARVIAQCNEYLPGTEQNELSAASLELPDVLETEGDVEELRERLECLDVLGRLEIVAQQDNSHAQLALAERTLAAEVEDDDVAAVGDGIRRLLHGYLASPTPRAEGTIASLLQAIASSEWTPAALAAELRNIMLGAEPTFAAAHPDLELTAADVRASIAAAPQRRWDTAQDWLRYTTTDPVMVAATIGPYLAGAGTTAAELLSEVDRWCRSLPQTTHESVLEILVGRPASPELTTAGLAAVRVSALPDARAAALLSARYQAESTIDGRKQVLRVWRAASIRAEQPKRQLVRTVLLDMLTRNQGSAEAALDAAVALVRPLPSGTKIDLRDALTVAGHRWSSLRKHAELVADELGLPKPKRAKRGK